VNKNLRNIEKLNIFAMRKEEKSGKKPQSVSVLNVLKDLNQVEPLAEDIVQSYLNEDVTTEVVEEEKESVEKGTEVTPEQESILPSSIEPIKPSVEETESEQKIPSKEDAFTTWLNEVKQRQKVKKEDRAFIYLNEDVVNTFITVKEATGIAANHLISCILLDWIDAHKDNLTKLVRERKKKKILIDT